MSIKTSMKKIELFVLLILLLGIPFTGILSENIINGVVIDKKTNKPLQYVNIYIDGSANGTTSGVDGKFTLKNVSFPSQLIFSIISHDLTSKYLEKADSNLIVVKMSEKSYKLSELKVSGQNERKSNLALFKSSFLGTDKWGANAVLLNDSVLIFEKYNDTLRIDSSKVKVLNVMSAKSRSPLMVDLPLLGYTISVDLVNFSVAKYGYSSMSKFLGYYFFKPYDFKNEKQNIRFKKNRMDAYYSSSQHFCKAYFNNQLEQNGYIIAEKVYDDSLKKYIVKAPDYYDYVTFRDDKILKITGNKNKILYIYDYFNYNNKPIDLTKLKSYKSQTKAEFFESHWHGADNYSSVKLMADTCIIRHDGNIPNTNILFGGKLSNKKVGAMLPNDYMPGD